MVEAQPYLVYEAHSTDYQTPANLRALVQKHFAILKVGPATDVRHARGALGAGCQSSASGSARSSRRGCARRLQTRHDGEPAILEQILSVRAAGSWHLDQQYSLSDRIRYYWPVPAVEAALERLLANLDANPPPLTLLSQYLPLQYEAVRAGRLRPCARELVLHAIRARAAAVCGGLHRRSELT